MGEGRRPRRGGRDVEGRRTAEGAYRERKRTGWWRLLHPNGALTAKGAYTDGHKSGIWKTFDVMGRITAEKDHGE